jgi:hypothetical protein
LRAGTESCVEEEAIGQRPRGVVNGRDGRRAGAGNVREGDGLDETAWALKIQTEIMQRLFPHEAREIEALSAEM